MSRVDRKAVVRVITSLLATGVSVVAVEWCLKRAARRYLSHVCERTQGFACSAGTFVDTALSISVRSVAVGIVLYRFTGIDARQMIQGAGVGGLLIAYLVRDIIENFQAGLLLVTQPPFSTGDFITIRAQMLDHAGVVMGINLRHTLLKQEDGRIIHVPNSLLLKSILRTPGEA